MRISRLVVFVGFFLAVSICVPVQGAACTGMCWWVSGAPACGFTALQEGGHCTVEYDSWGRPIACAVWACSGGSGWTPENQGALPWSVEPGHEPIRAAVLEVEVTVVEPRT